MNDHERYAVYLEDVLFVDAKRPGLMTPLEISGIRGRTTPFSHPFLNMVSALPQAERMTMDTVEKVMAFFRDHGNKSFGWLVTPYSPPGCADLLLEKGMTQGVEMAGMAMSHIGQHGIEMNPDVRIEEIGEEHKDVFDKITAVAFGMPEETTRFMGECIYFNPKLSDRTRNYLAYVPGIEEPVGNASLRYIGDTDAVYLGGSGVLEAARGQGVYRALLAHRLNHAANDERKTALIQAMRATSAPICASLGFEEIVAQNIHIHSP